MLGLPKGEVFLIPWTVEWEKEFLLEKERIEEVIGNKILSVHHIGSTSIKDLSSKPIIDIAIVIQSFQDGTDCVVPLEKLSYAYKGPDLLPDRHYFNKGEPRTHQIHMYQSDNRYLLEQLAFRDYLRINDEARVQYENLKQELSLVNSKNKHKYANDKTEFVRYILDKIKLQSN
ncbi:GrpB family protein [Paenibacillus radicis (ex Xue et al. 2023)]|uniref:GrpB family protein n=1 Tax=Paenibacillus radicis (ex Xue et al. 2023) TaxID=2972489 RepID=A0ABT1YBL7_9BACL|nr:GrpB family protein [Paenibacillus radicis (ex Xue et al. 2023)]MCR8630297.1 GrpB family protein [Paenibacillus radicis (ex Xue et al. 2023)]